MKMREPNRLVIGIVFLTVILICPSAYGQDATSSHDKWEFLLIPYFWLTGLDGDVTVSGIESSADVSFSDIWENLDLGGGRCTSRPGKANGACLLTRGI